MQQTAIDFTSTNGVSLEGVLVTPDVTPDMTPDAPGPPFPAVVVCHPSPTLGGNMDHPLVTAICRTAHREGVASLRFNFRGVGDSQGTFGSGPEEQRDLESALKFVRLLPGVDGKRLGLVGYSFGAAVVLGGLRRYKGARSLVFIAPPLSAVKKSGIRKDKRPKLFMVGQRDRVVPSVQLQRELDDVRQPVQFVELPGDDHSLRSSLDAVAERVAEFLLQTLNEG